MTGRTSGGIFFVPNGGWGDEVQSFPVANKRRTCYYAQMDEGRKRVLGITSAVTQNRPMMVT
jgi:hypothetical protein